ncbi:glycosyltransferase [Patescibacteria group bacterium]
MKTILVLHRYPPQQVVGTNASFIEFLKELSLKGYKTYYLTYKEESQNSRKLDEEINNLEFIRIPFSFNRGNNFDKKLKTYLWIITAPFYVSRLQKKHNIDLVYCDDSVPFYGFFSKILSSRSKVIIRLGDLQTGYALADEHPKLFKLILKVERYMWGKVDGIIAISNPFKAFIVKQGIGEEKIKVVKESINLDGVDFEKVDASKTGVVAFHGSVVKCKGLKVLLDAFYLFNTDFPETKLVVAGGGEEESRIKQYAKEKDIKNVEFTGWYDHNKLDEIMDDVQIAVVMRSPNMANNFVVTTCLLEDWKFKKPVLVPDLEAFKEVIVGGENGVLFKVGNVEDLSDKLRVLYKEEQRYERLVRGGLTTAKETFDHKKIAKSMVEALFGV